MCGLRHNAGHGLLWIDAEWRKGSKMVLLTKRVICLWQAILLRIEPLGSSHGLSHDSSVMLIYKFSNYNTTACHSMLQRQTLTEKSKFELHCLFHM